MAPCFVSQADWVFSPNPRAVSLRLPQDNRDHGIQLLQTPQSPPACLPLESYMKCVVHRAALLSQDDGLHGGWTGWRHESHESASNPRWKEELLLRLHTHTHTHNSGNNDKWSHSSTDGHRFNPLGFELLPMIAKTTDGPIDRTPEGETLGASGVHGGQWTIF